MIDPGRRTDPWSIATSLARLRDSWSPGSAEPARSASPWTIVTGSPSGSIATGEVILRASQPDRASAEPPRHRPSRFVPEVGQPGKRRHPGKRQRVGTIELALRLESAAVRPPRAPDAHRPSGPVTTTRCRSSGNSAANWRRWSMPRGDIEIRPGPAATILTQPPILDVPGRHSSSSSDRRRCDPYSQDYDAPASIRRESPLQPETGPAPGGSRRSPNCSDDEPIGNPMIRRRSRTR
jgi:hypothetical protein